MVVPNNCILLCRFKNNNIYENWIPIDRNKDPQLWTLCSLAFIIYSYPAQTKLYFTVYLIDTVLPCMLVYTSTACYSTRHLWKVGVQKEKLTNHSWCWWCYWPVWSRVPKRPKIFEIQISGKKCPSFLNIQFSSKMVVVYSITGIF